MTNVESIARDAAGAIFERILEATRRTVRMRSPRRSP